MLGPNSVLSVLLDARLDDCIDERCIACACAWFGAINFHFLKLFLREDDVLLLSNRVLPAGESWWGVWGWVCWWGVWVGRLQGGTIMLTWRDGGMWKRIIVGIKTGCLVLPHGAGQSHFGNAMLANVILSGKVS